MLCETHARTNARDDDERLGSGGGPPEGVGRQAFPAAGGSTQRLKIAQSPDAALRECVSLRSLLDATPGLIARVDGPDHLFQFANSAWLGIIDGDLIGRAVRDVFPPAEARGLLTLLDAIRAGAPATGDEQRHTIAVTPAGQSHPIHLDFVCRPVIGLRGALLGIVLEGADVTHRVLADERRQLLLYEMAHRVKNTSATMLGLARLARGSATDLDAFLASLTDRLVAMCRTQDLLTARQSKLIPVRDVLNLELEPYLDQGADSVVRLVCQELTLEGASAVTLSMIVHELLTNALKYGAFAGPGGRLQVSCAAVAQEAVLKWSETTPGRIGPIATRGFGSRMVERLAKSLGGHVHFTPRQDGLDVIVTFKVEADVRERPLACA